MRRLFYFGLIIVMMLLLTACNNKETEVTSNSPNYATNETRKPISSDVESVESVTSTTTTTTVPVETTTITSIPDQIYNVEPDANASNIKDMGTIYVDGKLIGFPCKYEYVVDKFGQLYNIEYSGKFGDRYVPIDLSSVSNEFEVYALPTTGEGFIKLLFNSDSPTTIDKMQCIGITVTGGNTTGDKLMTFALPENITFGCTLDKLLDVYDVNNATHYESSNNATDYRIRFVFEDINQCYEFVGYDNGLYMATLLYNYSN